jgi:hypothetical protein
MKLYCVTHLVLMRGGCLCDTEIFNRSIHITEAGHNTVMITWYDILKVNPSALHHCYNIRCSIFMDGAAANFLPTNG